MQILKLRFRDKIQVLNTNNLLYQKFAVSVRKVQIAAYHHCISRHHNQWMRNLQGGPKKWHKVNDTIILQPYVTDSCGF